MRTEVSIMPQRFTFSTPSVFRNGVPMDVDVTITVDINKLKVPAEDIKQKLATTFSEVLEYFDQY